MPSQKYALIKGGPKRLEISWRIFSQKRTVYLDRQELGVIPDDKTLKAGWKLTSKNGTKLSIKKGSAFGGMFDVRLNGVPLPDSDQDPQRQLKITVGLIAFIAIVNLIVGLTVGGSSNNLLGITSADQLYVFITGLIYAVLAFFVWRLSLVALVLTIIGYIVDSLPLFISLASIELGGGLGGLFTRAIFLSVMIQGIQPLRALKAEKKSTDSPRPPLTRTELSLQLVAYLLVSLVVILVIGRFISKGGLDLFKADTAVWETPPIAIQPTNQPQEDMILLPFNVGDIKYSKAIDAIVVLSRDPHALHIIYDIEAGDYTTMNLDEYPRSLAMSLSDGRYVAIGHDYKLSYLDLTTDEAPVVIDLDIRALLLTVGNNGRAYALDLITNKNLDREERIPFQFVDLISQKLVYDELIPNFSTSLYTCVLSADGKRLYLGAVNAGVYRFELDPSGSLAGQSFEHFQTDLERGGIALSEDGNYLFTDTSIALKLSDDAADDLKQAIYLNKSKEFTDHIPQSFGSTWIARGRFDGTVEFWPNDALTTSTYVVISAIRQPPPVISGEDDNHPARDFIMQQILMNRTGTRYYMIFYWNKPGFRDQLSFGLIARDVPPIE